jgi:hypothetical protein
MPVLTGVVCSLAVRALVTSSSGQVRKVVNVFTYEHISGPLPATFRDELAVSFHLAVWSNVATLLHVDYLGDAYVAYTDTQLAPPGVVTVQTPPNGSVAGGREPISTCINFGFLTGLRGKSFRSIKRIGPVATSQVSGDELTAAAQAAWAGQAALLLNNVTTASADVWAPRLLSRQLSSVGPPAVFVGAPVSAITVNRTLGLARHRRERTVR